MKLVIDLEYIDQNNSPITSIRKEYQNVEFLPVVGDTYDDSLFKHGVGREVISRAISYQENFCYITLPREKISISKEEIERIAKMNGWTPYSELKN